MEVQRLVMRNFCQYTDRTMEFSPYVNLIAGPNGSGKTNAFRAILFLLIGDAQGSGVKSDNVYQLAPESEPAFVEGTFTHDGHTLEIHRGLRKSGNWLSLDGQQLTESSREMNALILQHLQTSVHILTNYAMVQQRKIDAWIDRTDSER